MPGRMGRREFVQLSMAGSALCLASSGATAVASVGVSTDPRLLSPGCRKSKVKVARLYLGTSHGLWPKPNLDFEKEVQLYRAECEARKDQLADVDFVVDQVVTSPEDVRNLRGKLEGVDGILAIHLNIGITPILREVLAVNRPTVLFAQPYSGHEWVGFAALQNEPLGQQLSCILSSDFGQLAVAIRPFRAIHHLRETKILNVTDAKLDDIAAQMKKRFGTELVRVDLNRLMACYDSIDPQRARQEAEAWTKGATAVVEPSAPDILNSCRLALAFEKLLDEEQATVMTADCYGTMHGPLCRKYAYPCVGFTRLNDMGFAGICESDLNSALTFVILQGLCGRPGFISDPTVDESNNSIILAHCLGTRRMDGPQGPTAPYKLRTIMERQEGVVAQVKMRVGEKVTQAILRGMEVMPYFTGEIIDAPDVERGCRTKITVKIDGSAQQLWKNWSDGLHRVTVYGDLRSDLERFCRFTRIKMIDEAAV